MITEATAASEIVRSLFSVVVRVTNSLLLAGYITNLDARTTQFHAIYGLAK